MELKIETACKRVSGAAVQNEWTQCVLGEDIFLLSGHHIMAHHCNTTGVGVPYLTGPSDFSSGAIRHTKFTDRPTTLCKPGDVLVTVKGSGTGTLVMADDVYCISRQLMAVRVRDWDSKYIFYTLVQTASQFQAASTGLIPGLSRSDISGLPLLLPPIAEQRAIANALSDVDALIAGLDRLIAKKRDIKQAAMQQLLTGQTRLPGFSGEWVSRPLGELGATYGGLVGKSKADFGHGEASYVPFVNVMANICIDCDAFEPVDVASTESQNRVLSGDLLFNGSSETPEEVALCALMPMSVENLYLNSFCFGFRLKLSAEASGLFLTYLMRSQVGRELMKSLAQGSTRYNLSKSALLQATLKLPGLDEQAAISIVLSDMDADISTLESRLAKALAIKQGMMQELLTGRTRLV